MVYIKKYNRNILPGYIPPYNGELFTSWYCRLAINHGVKPLTLIKNNFDYNAPIFNRDIDNLSPSYLLDFLGLHTPLYKTRIKKLFLDSYNGIYFSDDTKNRNNILALGLNHRDRTGFGMMCCPECLKKNPYYKKEWRLFTSIVCTKCRSYLIDRCPGCKKPISYHRIYNSDNQSAPDLNRPFSSCWHCKNDLAFTKTEKPNGLEIRYQLFINRTLKKGFNKYSDYSFSFIHGLILLCRVSRSKRFKQRLGKLLYDTYQIKLLPVEKNANLWSHQERKETLPYIFQFLEDTPKLKDEISYYKISSSYLGQVTFIDYWLYDLLGL